MLTGEHAPESLARLGTPCAGQEFVTRFERAAAASPDRPAVISPGYPTLTYAQLAGASNRIASELLLRTQDREPVVVLGHKSPLMAAGFIGCLKAGHAFVPVDTEMPPARLLDIMDQLGGPFLLATEDVPPAVAGAVAPGCRADVRGLLADVPALAASASDAPDPSRWVRGDETQYIIFTSGSTGRPKGIEVSAANVSHFAEWMGTLPVVREGGRSFLDQPPYSFDLSEYELVGALTTGGTLHAVGREALTDMAALFAQLAASDMDVWVSTPSFADMCLVDKGFGEPLLPKVRLFLFCGEPLHHNTARELRRRFPHAVLANTYGPTETTVAVTYCELTDAMLDSEAPLPVGSARPGVALSVRDVQTQEPCPAGVTGEIVIAGPSVSKGYYRNPEKTRSAFFELPAGEAVSPSRGMRAYRTGDLGFLDADGTLHCEGRMDSLVKLNGFRIELGDVEENIAQLPMVEQVAVVPVSRDGRVTHLRACVVLRPGARASLGEDASDFDVACAIKEALAQRLPGYMVPRKVSILPELPVTPNGKVDRKALAAGRPAGHRGSQAPGPDAR